MEDSTIVEMYWNRDEDAIYWTNQKYGTMCQNIAYSILDSHEDAEECTNDTWLKAWNSMPPLRPKNLKAWLGRVARNLALDRWDRSHALKRGKGVERLESTEQMWEELGKCIPDSRTPEKEVEGEELGRFLEKWLRTLPKDDRQLFLRRYWYGERVKDLAAERGEMASFTALRLSRLREKLKKALKKEGLM
ncbi:MAG: sigma-70 family RNA polymerase sigma factor [Lachnospiraceae bacterium]|nr:sigma-70 family RNA polymerase sigma factor [Lachnospiraceae bacterium]